MVQGRGDGDHGRTDAARLDAEERRARTRCRRAAGPLDRDIEAWLVRDGQALAYRQYSLDYVDQEQRPQVAESGMWRGEFVPPWEWRRGILLQTPTAFDGAAGRLIKGDIAKSGGHIYQVPGGRFYENTKINTAMRPLSRLLGKPTQCSTKACWTGRQIVAAINAPQRQKPEPVERRH